MNIIKSITLILFIILLQSCTNSTIVATKKFQKELSNEWNDPIKTPLKEDEKANFKGITFFPIHKKYIVNAKFESIDDPKTLPFPTSAKKIKHYKEYGKIFFTIDNQPLELTIYQSDPPIEGYEDNLFLPFMDETNGISSYGGGRYLDFKLSDIKNNQLLVNFNEAYNPYCAYSKHYNCPIPPANNRLPIEILAGVSYNE